MCSVHTHKSTFTEYVWDMRQNLPGLAVACGGTLFAWFNLLLPGVPRAWNTPWSPLAHVPVHFRDVFPGRCLTTK